MATITTSETTFETIDTSKSTATEAVVEPQHSHFLSLPAEILNLIAFYAFTTSKPIINPSPNSTLVSKHAHIPSEHLTIKPKHQSIPALGTALLRTSSYLSTLDTRPLYSHNNLVFTRVAHLTAFVSSLPSSYRPLLRGLTLSLSEASVLPASSDGTPTDPISLEWLHYLTCPAHMRDLPPGFWCARLSTLFADVPYLKRLSIDIKGLHRLAGPGAGVTGTGKVGTRAFLGHLLAKIRGLERLEIVGQGADIWDLASVNRPFGYMGWHAIARWMDLVGDALVEVLSRTVADDGTAWVGFMIGKGRYGLVACKSEPSDRDVVGMGYEEAWSWEEAVALTKEKKMWGHPVFKILGAGSQCNQM